MHFIKAMALRVADRSMQLELDRFIRLSILERVAGLKPGDWSRASAAAFTEVQAHFPGIAKIWVTRNDTLTYAFMVSSAAKPLGGDELAEEVVSGILGSSSIFDALAAKILEGRDLSEKDSFDMCKSLLARHAYHRAVSISRTRKFKKDRDPHNTTLGPVPGEEGHIRDLGPTDTSNQDLDAIRHLLSGPNRERMYQALLEVWENDRNIQPSYLNTFKAMREHPDLDVKELAELLHIDVSRVHRVLRKLTEAGADAMQRGLLPPIIHLASNKQRTAAQITAFLRLLEEI